MENNWKGSKKFKIRILKANESKKFIELIKLFEIVFQMKDLSIPDANHLNKLLSKESFTAVIAEIEGLIIGGATVYTLDQYYSINPIAYIYDLAIKEEFQRQGIGRQIITFINEHFQGKGFEEVFVQADEVDGYALDFYRTTKPTAEEKVVHYYYNLNDNNDSNLK